jgi:hypothetical protein
MRYATVWTITLGLVNLCWFFRRRSVERKAAEAMMVREAGVDLTRPAGDGMAWIMPGADDGGKPIGTPPCTPDDTIAIVAAWSGGLGAQQIATAPDAFSGTGGGLPGPGMTTSSCPAGW